MRIIEREVPTLANIHRLHIEFDNNWYRSRTIAARRWVADWLFEITMRYNMLELVGLSPANSQRVRAGVDSLFRDLQYMEPPPQDPNVP